MPALPFVAMLPARSPCRRRHVESQEVDGASVGAVFGVFRTDTPQRIRAEFTGWAATNVREMQWHPSQRIVSDDGQTVTVTFDLGSTVEFKRWMLGFGRHARVTSPADLAEDIRQEHRIAAEMG